MGTKIQWADETWNPCTGCTRISEACDNCYALRMLCRNLPSHSGPEPTFHPDRLDKPLHWHKPRRIFVCSMSDLFHDAFTDTERDAVFAVMALCPQHQFLVLTKRPDTMRRYCADPVGQTTRRDWLLYQAGQILNRVHVDGFPDWPLPNVWLGVTAENQARADERIPILLDTPAAVRFVSVEPMLGPVRLGCMPDEMGFTWLFGPKMSGGIDWVICGPETGPGKRPFESKWAALLRNQCVNADVAYFDKRDSHAGWRAFPQVQS